MYVASQLTDDRRGGDRLGVERPAVLRFGVTAETIELLDLTTGGCRFRARETLPLFARVSIGIAGIGHRVAHIIWKGDGSYGCAFEEPLPPSFVTAEAPDNVKPLLTATRLRQAELEGDLVDDEKLPVQVRLLVMVGLAGGLWAGLFGIARSLLRVHF